MNSDQSKQFAEDQLKARGKFVEPFRDTPESKLAAYAMGIWNDVSNNTLKTLLASLQTPSQYDRAGTQLLLKSAFETRFNRLSKDETVMLLSIMHAEELEKQAYAMAQAGHIGPLVDKNLA